MPKIIIETLVKAPIELVFDMSRDIDLHKYTSRHTNEEAISGVTSGHIGLGQQVTWKAKHFGITQKLTVEITKMEFPTFFQDEMVKGAFKSFIHEHHFIKEENGTKVIDIFNYTSPLGILGKLADKLFLKRYMTSFLEKRNRILKEEAEKGSGYI